MRSPKTIVDVSNLLRKLRDRLRRRVWKRRDTRGPRRKLTNAQRKEILRKTNRHCHICGGKITGNRWHANHIKAYSTGGVHSVDNFLPSHSECNKLRRRFGPAEIRWIFSLGVWLRTQIANETRIGRVAGHKFWAANRKKR